MMRSARRQVLVGSATSSQGNSHGTTTPPHYTGAMPRSLEKLRAEAQLNAAWAEQRALLQARLKRIDDGLRAWDLWDVYVAHLPADPLRFPTPTITREGLEMLREGVLEQLGELEAEGW